MPIVLLKKNRQPSQITFLLHSTKGESTGVVTRKDLHELNGGAARRGGGERVAFKVHDDDKAIDARFHQFERPLDGEDKVLHLSVVSHGIFLGGANVQDRPASAVKPVDIALAADGFRFDHRRRNERGRKGMTPMQRLREHFERTVQRKGVRSQVPHLYTPVHIIIRKNAATTFLLVGNCTRKSYQAEIGRETDEVLADGIVADELESLMQQGQRLLLHLAKDELLLFGQILDR